MVVGRCTTLEMIAAMRRPSGIQAPDWDSLHIPRVTISTRSSVRVGIWICQSNLYVIYTLIDERRRERFVYTHHHDTRTTRASSRNMALFHEPELRARPSSSDSVTHFDFITRIFTIIVIVIVIRRDDDPIDACSGSQIHHNNIINETTPIYDTSETPTTTTSLEDNVTTGSIETTMQRPGL